MNLFGTIKNIVKKAVAIFQESNTIEHHSDDGQLKLVAKTAGLSSDFSDPASDDAAALNQPMSPELNDFVWPEQQDVNQPKLIKPGQAILELFRQKKQKDKEQNELKKSSSAKITSAENVEKSDLVQPETTEAAEAGAASEIFNKLNEISTAVRQFSYEKLKYVHGWHFGTNSENNAIADNDSALQKVQIENSGATMFLDLVGAGFKGLANLTLKVGYTSLYITHSLLIDEKSYGNNEAENNTLIEKDASVMAGDLLCFGVENLLKITSNAGDLIDRGANDAYKYLNALNSYNHLNKNGCDQIKMADVSSEDGVLVDFMGCAAISMVV